MPKLNFVIKPDYTNALTPILVRWAFRYSIGAVFTYAVFSLLSRLGVFFVSSTRLIFALVVVVIMLSFSSIKMHLLVLHNTRYLFYDTHVVEERKLIVAKRTSMPYKHISKVVNNSSVWNRISGASDITLRSARQDEDHDLTLRSIKNSEDVEHKIYTLLKEDSRARH